MKTLPQTTVSFKGRKHPAPPEALANLNKTQVFFASKVRSLRLSIGLSMRAFALKAKIDPSYLTLIERDGRIPSSLRVADIAKALGVPPSDLFPLVKGSPKPDNDCVLALARRINKLSVRDFATVLTLLDHLQPKKDKEDKGEKL